jgi:hypothetical protein
VLYSPVGVANVLFLLFSIVLVTDAKKKLQVCRPLGQPDYCPDGDMKTQADACNCSTGIMSGYVLLRLPYAR